MVKAYPIEWPNKPEFVKRVVFQHYRVPDAMIPPRMESKYWPNPKGQPLSVMLFHYRKGVDQWRPSLYGGKTVCMLETVDGKRVTAEAVCSLSDPFSYDTGRQIAFTRAVNQAIKADNEPGERP